MALVGLYARDGSWNVTVVDGNSLTGLYARDGSLNVIVAGGTLPKGRFHACGAWYVTVSADHMDGMTAPDGSLYVCETPYSGGGQRVTVVSGSLGGGPAHGASILLENGSYLLLENGSTILLEA